MVFYVPNIAVRSLYVRSLYVSFIKQGLPIRHSDGREKRETVQLWISFALLGCIFEIGEVISCHSINIGKHKNGY